MKLIRYAQPGSRVGDWDAFFPDPFAAFAPFFAASERSRSRGQSDVSWFENDESYVARVEVPGIARDQLEIASEEGVVRLAVSRRGESENGTERSELTLRTPDGVDFSRVRARLENGILELTFPKAEERKPVTVEIQ